MRTLIFLGITAMQPAIMMLVMYVLEFFKTSGNTFIATCAVFAANIGIYFMVKAVMRVRINIEVSVSLLICMIIFYLASTANIKISVIYFCESVLFMIFSGFASIRDFKEKSRAVKGADLHRQLNEFNKMYK